MAGDSDRPQITHLIPNLTQSPRLKEQNMKIASPKLRMSLTFVGVLLIGLGGFLSMVKVKR